jgi:hypothetical protein
MDAVCTPEEEALPQAVMHCLTRKQSSGLLVRPLYICNLGPSKDLDRADPLIV